MNSFQLPRPSMPILFTGPHPCAYLPSQIAATVVVDPLHPVDVGLYQTLVDQGFRRSGELLYRPTCPRCRQCIPARLPVQRFVRSGGWHRVWKRNRDLTVTPCEAVFKGEHYQLYRRYLDSRHADGPMAQDQPDDYLDGLVHPGLPVRFYEFRQGERLVMVAVVDWLPDGLSAVYTFFEPALAVRSLGSYAILWEIELARTLNKSWLYLGYWIPECRKMSYKSRFNPLEILWNGHWVELEGA